MILLVSRFDEVPGDVLGSHVKGEGDGVVSFQCVLCSWCPPLMKHQSLVGYASVVEREGDVACTGREGRVVDHGKSPVFNVRVHMKDAIIICVRGKKNVHTE